MEKNKLLLKAALLHFQSEKAAAEVNLAVYIKNAVGIGEHPDIVKEVIELTKKIAEADECIQVLQPKLV